MSVQLRVFHLQKALMTDPLQDYHSFPVGHMLSNLLYKLHQIPIPKCFWSRLAVAFVQYVEAWC